MQSVPGAWCRAHLASSGLVDGDTLHATLLQAQATGAALARVRRDPAGRVCLRLLGLDAPETSCTHAPPGFEHQPLQAALAASEALQHALALPTNGADVWLYLHGIDRYGRLLAVVYDGAHRQVPPPVQAPSLNSRLLAAGAAYPDLSAGLPPALLATLRQAGRSARQEQRGLWPQDRTGAGFPLSPLRTLTDTCLIWPRLFRRIMECARQQRSADPGDAPHLTLAMLREFLQQRDGAQLARHGGPAKNLGEWLEMAGQDCRFPGDVENFLHQAPPGSGKLT